MNSTLTTLCISNILDNYDQLTVSEREYLKLLVENSDVLPYDHPYVIQTIWNDDARRLLHQEILFNVSSICQTLSILDLFNSVSINDALHSLRCANQYVVNVYFYAIKLSPFVDQCAYNSIILIIDTFTVLLDNLDYSNMSLFEFMEFYASNHSVEHVMETILHIVNQDMAVLSNVLSDGGDVMTSLKRCHAKFYSVKFRNHEFVDGFDFWTDID